MSSCYRRATCIATVAMVLLGSTNSLDTRAQTTNSIDHGLDYRSVQGREPLAVRDGRYKDKTVSLLLAPQASHPDMKLLSFDELKKTMNQFCYRCHGGGATEADIDLTAFTRRETLLADIDTTRGIRESVARHEMPPEGEKQPRSDLRAQFIATLDSMIEEHLADNGSSAPIVTRQLDRYEYKSVTHGWPRSSSTTRRPRRRHRSIEAQGLKLAPK